MPRNDKSSFDIFSTLFVPKKTSPFEYLRRMFTNQNQVFYTTLGVAIIITILCSIIALRSSSTLLFWNNPLEGNTRSLAARTTIQKEEPTLGELNERIDRIARTYGQLISQKDVSDYPLLGAMRSIIREQIDWTRVFTGIDDAIKNVVAGNDIVKRILIGSITMQYKEKLISIENMRIYGTKGNDNEATGISLAAQLLDSLEKSTTFKNVSSTTLEQKVEIKDDGKSSEFFTPLNVSLFYQEPYETNEKDETNTLKPELDTVSP